MSHFQKGRVLYRPLQAVDSCSKSSTPLRGCQHAMPPDSPHPQPAPNPAHPSSASDKTQHATQSVSHGSYKRYYRRRLNGAHPANDNRLPHIRAALSSYPAAKILDIGCNDGLITSQLARLKNAYSVTGVDLDPTLISRARRLNKRRRRDVRDRLKKLRNSDPSFVPLSCKVVQGSRLSSRPSAPDANTPASDHIDNSTSTPLFHDRFPFNLSYRCEDVVSETPGSIAAQVAEYDVVLCLSVTKWVHLHDGDVGLERLFKRIYSLLKPGGILILEPQLGHSYRRARQRASKASQDTFEKDLKLKPAQFPSYLTSAQVGFEKFRVLKGIGEKGQSFNRRIYAFYKKHNKYTHSVVEQIVEQILEEASRGTDASSAHGVAGILGSILEDATVGETHAGTKDPITPEEEGKRGVKRKRSLPVEGDKSNGGPGGKYRRKDTVGRDGARNSDTLKVSDTVAHDDKGENVVKEGEKKEDAGRGDEKGEATAQASGESRGIE